MATLVQTLHLAAGALGTVGGVLVFLELFMTPSYVEYEEDFGEYNIDMAPADLTEHTWLGRVGALLVALAFALQFFAALQA